MTMLSARSTVRQRLTVLLVACVAMVGINAGFPAAALAAVHPGAFCAAADEGKVGYTVTGVMMHCVTSPTDSRLRWRAVFEDRPQMTVLATRQFIAIHERG